ncbi:hypothetical protein KZ870_40840 [Pseudomonas aeruginosa]|nr:hypothetical protein [Pseudomonas aeruginosa]
MQHLDDQPTVRRGAAQQFAQVPQIARALGGAAEAAGDGEEVRGVDIDACLSFTYHSPRDTR